MLDLTKLDFTNLPLLTVIATVVVYLIDFGIRLWLLIYIPKGRKPTAALAWLLAVFLVPVLGTALFFVLGSTKLSKRRRDAQIHINHMFKRYTSRLRAGGFIAKVDKPYDIRARLAESLTALPATNGNAVTILSGYDSIIKEMTERVRQAKLYVYVEFYALVLDATTEPFFEALEQARLRGVVVRVLFDTFGSNKYPKYRQMKRRLTDMDVQWHKILPIKLKFGQYNRPDLRNHRKILVVDNCDAYIGSLNMIDKGYHRKDGIEYLELVAHLQGPCVNNAAAVFAGDWYAETGEFLKHFMHTTVPARRGKAIVQIVPSGSGYPYANNLELFTSFIQSARSSVLITNPYLVPDEALLNALMSAAQRGVKVSVLNSQAIDQWMVAHAQRSYYEELLKSGIQLFLYRKPKLVHEKFMVIDDKVGIIGSSNLDIRSFELNMECVVTVYDASVAKTLRRHHNSMLDKSQPVHLAAWKKRGVWQSFLDSVARLTSALQ